MSHEFQAILFGRIDLFSSFFFVLFFFVFLPYWQIYNKASTNVKLKSVYDVNQNCLVMIIKRVCMLISLNTYIPPPYIVLIIGISMVGEHYWY